MEPQSSKGSRALSLGHQGAANLQQASGTPGGVRGAQASARRGTALHCGPAGVLGGQAGQPRGTWPKRKGTGCREGVAALDVDVGTGSLAGELQEVDSVLHSAEGEVQGACHLPT